MRHFHITLRLLALCLCVGLLAACGGKQAIGKRAPVESAELQFQGPQEGDTIAIFDTSKGELRAVLYPALAPMACDNFIGLAQQGYYSGTTFHRVEYGSYIQGGDATGTGNGSATIWNADTFPLESSQKLRHYSGALCVAFDRDSKTATGQFYIVTTPPGNLDSGMLQRLSGAGYSQEAIDAYTAAGGLPQQDNVDTVFGQIYQGQAVADAISAVTVDDASRPAQNVTINSITITTYTTEG